MSSPDVSDVQTINAVLSTDEIRKQQRNQAPAYQGSTHVDRLVSFTGSILLARRTPVGGSAASEKGLVHTVCALNGLGTKTGGKKSVAETYYPVGFNISTYNKAGERFGTIGQRCVAAVQGKMTVPVISSGWRRGNLLTIRYPDDTPADRKAQEKRLPSGVPDGVLFAELVPIENSDVFSPDNLMSLIMSEDQSIVEAFLEAFGKINDEKLGLDGEGMTVLKAAYQTKQIPDNADDAARLMKAVRGASSLAMIMDSVWTYYKSYHTPVLAIALEDGIPGRESTIMIVPNGFVN